jgi:hypothetical protein
MRVFLKLGKKGEEVVHKPTILHLISKKEPRYEQRPEQQEGFKERTRQNHERKEGGETSEEE